MALVTYVSMRLADLRVGVQRIGVGAQCADLQPAIIDGLAHGGNGIGIVQHLGRLEMGVADIAAAADLDRFDADRFDVVQRVFKCHGAEGDGKNANFHDATPSILSLL